MKASRQKWPGAGGSTGSILLFSATFGFSIVVIYVQVSPVKITAFGIIVTIGS